MFYACAITIVVGVVTAGYMIIRQWLAAQTGVL